MKEEKEIIQNIFTKDSIQTFEEQIQHVPENYFDNFSEKLLLKIQQQKKPSLLIQLSKLSIAATIILIITGTYFITNNNSMDNSSISIQEIPISALESYVSNNEWIAEAEIQTEINKLGLNLDINNTSKDSID